MTKKESKTMMNAVENAVENAVQVEPNLIFKIANMALAHAASLSPSLAPFAGTVVDKATARTAAAAVAAAARVSRAAEEYAAHEAAAMAWATLRAVEAVPSNPVLGVAVGQAKHVAYVSTMSRDWSAAEAARQRVIALCDAIRGTH